MLRVILDDLAEIAYNVAEIIWSLLLLSWLNLLVDLYYMLTEGSHENVTKRLEKSYFMNIFDFRYLLLFSHDGGHYIVGRYLQVVRSMWS